MIFFSFQKWRWAVKCNQILKQELKLGSLSASLNLSSMFLFKITLSYYYFPLLLYWKAAQAEVQCAVQTVKQTKEIKKIFIYKIVLFEAILSIM